MKFILVDRNNFFRTDLPTAMMIEDSPSEMLAGLSGIDNLTDKVSQLKPDAILVSSNAVSLVDNWNDFSVPVIGYCVGNDSDSVFKSRGMRSYGNIKSADELCQKIDAGIPAYEPMASQPAQPVHTYAPQSAVQSAQEAPQPAMRQTYEIPQQEQSPAPVQAAPTVRPVQAQAQNHQTYENPIQQQMRTQEKQSAQARLIHDLTPPAHKTELISVYSSKGGVGKTTIAAELAVLLSCMSHGRSTYKVCLVDFNIDFGNVQTVLGLSKTGSTIAMWAADISEKIEGGIDPAALNYTAEEIANYLQVYDKSPSLSVLVAPLSHVDAYGLDNPVIIECILRNLIDHSGFDYVICDDGNNIQDCTLISLRMADYILLLMTQDMSTADATKKLFVDTAGTLERYNKPMFDQSHVRLVLNRVIPASYARISVEALANYFKQYPHIATFKEDPTVTGANNTSEPLVFDANHDFTREMAKLAAHITGQVTVATVAKKSGLKGFLSRFKKGG